MSVHKSDNFILAADLNFGNSYCKYPVLSPKPLDDTAPELFSRLGLTQLIDIPTRVKDSIRGVTTSLIDLIFCKDIDDIQSHGTLPCIADHDCVFVSFNCHIEKVQQRTKRVFDYKNVDEVALIDHIKAFNFEAILSKPVVEQAEALTALLTDAFVKFVPVKNVVTRSNDQPWVNSYTRLLLRKKNRNYQLFKKINTKFLAAKANPDCPPEVSTSLLLKREQATKKSHISMKQSTNANTRAKKNFSTVFPQQCTTATFPQRKSFQF